MAKAMVPLERRMNAADRVQIKGPEPTLLSASKASAQKCAKATATSRTAKCFRVR